jgi:hypothetical protein
VCFIIPYLGYLSEFLRTKLGYVLLVILPALLTVSLEIKIIIRELRGMKSYVT